MDEQPLDTSPEKKQPPSQSKIEVGDIRIGGNVDGNFIIGQNINITPEQQVFRSLHQLPQPPADFTGREELIAQFLADFERGKGATITGQPIHGLVGMGGVGKTVLGLVVAHQLKKDYPDAQIFLDLKGTTTPLSAIDIMRHVILSFEPTADLRTVVDEADMAAKYQSVLYGKRALLFLDNARSSEQIAPLRPPETCALLVSSRWTFGVPGLKNRQIGVMNAENAEKFLLELCPRIGDQVDELAKACAYLPLALRIAGSFLGVNAAWNVEKYIAQLNDRKRRLTTLKQSLTRAELTTEPDLLATFELSYNQLSEENQKFWRRLGVFPASFDMNAVSAICELDPEGDETAQAVGLFLRYSLLDYDDASPRYSLHDLLSDYALSQMEAAEEKDARLKHASHYKDILHVANNLYMEGGKKILTGLRLFDLERENIRMSQAWISQNSDDKDCLELCNEFPVAGRMILSLTQHPRERLAWLEKALQAARKLGKKKDEGYHLGSLGNAYYRLGEVRKAIEFHQGHLAIARETGDRYGEEQALGNLGIGYRNLGEVPKAIEFYEQRLAIAREIGDLRGEGTALGNLGNAYDDLGETHKAIEFHEGDLAIARETGDRYGEGRALGNLGNAYYSLGEFHKVIEFYNQSLAIAREIGDRRGQGIALGNLGNAYKKLGDVRKAIEFYEQALVMAQEIGDRHGQGRHLFNMGIALYDLEQEGQAIGLVKNALEIYEAIESPDAEEAQHTLEGWSALQKAYNKGKSSSWIDRIRQKLGK